MEALIAYFACVCILLIFGRIFVIPIKIIGKILLNSIIGVILLYIINLIGKNYAFHIGLNWITVGVCRNTWNTRDSFVIILKNVI